MTIPASKLVLNIDVMHLTLGDVAAFDGGFDPSGVRRFLIKYGNWSAAEVNDIEFGEMTELGTQVQEAMQAAAIPLASRPRSTNGRGPKPKRRRRGSAASSTPSNSTANPRT